MGEVLSYMDIAYDIVIYLGHQEIGVFCPRSHAGCRIARIADFHRAWQASCAKVNSRFIIIIRIFKTYIIFVFMNYFIKKYTINSFVCLLA